MHWGYQAREEVIAGFEGGTPKSKVEHARIEVLGHGVPEADRRTSIEHGRAVSVEAADTGTFQHLNLGLIP
jgi:hypothetical protein